MVVDLVNAHEACAPCNVVVADAVETPNSVLEELKGAFVIAADLPPHLYEPILCVLRGANDFEGRVLKQEFPCVAEAMQEELVILAPSDRR